MQSPDRNNRDYQNHEIAHNVDDASAYEYGVLIETFPPSCNSVGLANAFSRNCKDERERVEKVPVEDKPNARAGFEISMSLSIWAKFAVSNFPWNYG